MLRKMLNVLFSINDWDQSRLFHTDRDYARTALSGDEIFRMHAMHYTKDCVFVFVLICGVR